MMAEVTLEALARRVEELERKLAAREEPRERKRPDWEKLGELFTDPEMMQQIIAEGVAIREAERQAAREGRFE